MEENVNEEELLTLDEVAHILKVSKWTLRQWDKKGLLIPAYRIGVRNERRYKKSDIEEYLKKQESHETN